MDDVSYDNEALRPDGHADEIAEAQGQAADEASQLEADEPQILRGPHAWLNWQAQRDGLPARKSSHTDVALVLPLWQEFGLYSDASFTGEIEFGPYRLMLAFPARRPRLGHPCLEFVLRARDHLLGPDTSAIDLSEQDVEAYAGGDLGDEIASLLALAVARRVRSGGVTRRGYENDPKGKPRYVDHHPPSLDPPRHGPLLPAVAEGAQLADAEPYFEAYAQLDGASAVAVLRAARQYADALWLADADPRIAWIKLFGALEAAADKWDADAHPDPVAQLKWRHPGLFRRLEREAAGAIPIVATSLSRVLGAESKTIGFVLAHSSRPPASRPEFGRLDFGNLEPGLHVLYDHRSRDLHGGIPFPDPLCRPPESDNAGVPAEVFSALAAAAGGGSWPAHRLPMFLHTFAYITGEALRRWWLHLPTAGAGDGE